MCFGAAALVWTSTAEDAIQQLVRALLLLSAGHLVDDAGAFGGGWPTVGSRP